jgi:transposase
LKRWYFWATHSRLAPMIEVAATVKRHRDGILRWFDSRIANGLIEARGYRSVRNLETIVYLIAGKLDFRLPA